MHTKIGGLIWWGKAPEIFWMLVVFLYVFTYCWLLSWRTKLKLTPCTKLADTTWKTSKTALKTDLQSWTNFQLAFLQLMYLHEKRFSWFFAGRIPLRRRKLTILCSWREIFLMQSFVRVWSGLLVRNWTDGWRWTLSQSTMSGTEKLALSFKPCMKPTMCFRLAQWRPPDRRRGSSNGQSWIPYEETPPPPHWAGRVPARPF